jgi:hypothetical protein
MLLIVEIFIKYCKIPLTSNIQRLARCQIVSYSGLWDRTYTNLSSYCSYTSDSQMIRGIVHLDMVQGHQGPLLPFMDFS